MFSLLSCCNNNRLQQRYGMTIFIVVLLVVIFGLVGICEGQPAAQCNNCKFPRNQNDGFVLRSKISYAML
jgi:hypothetical protein